MIGTSKAQALWACMAILLTAAPTATAQADALQDISFWTNSDQFPIVGVEIELCSACERCCECGDGCCDACCDCGSACCNKRLLGLIAPSDHCFDDFISPMTNPVFFEDPRTLTEARAIFLRHEVPTAALGGTVHLFAVQLRAALTDRLSIIATKDGFVTSTSPLIDDGWSDVAAGLKYNLFADPQSQRLLSTGFTYEMPVGTPRTLQGNGDGEFHLFLSGGMQLLENAHWISGTGFRIPSDPAAESRMWYWSNHLDYQMSDRWYVLTELNWYTWIGSGLNTTLPGVEGGDLFNLGSVGVSGNDIVTNAVGLKYKRSRHSEIGVAYEYPLTDRRDVLQNRLTVDWIFRY